MPFLVSVTQTGKCSAADLLEGTSEMIASFQREARVNWLGSVNTEVNESTQVGSANTSPVKIVTNSNVDDVLPIIESSFDQQPGTNDVNRPSLPDNNTQHLQESFAGFFGNLSSLGKDEKSSIVPSIVASMTCGLFPTVGQFAFSVMAQSIQKACASLASFIGPDKDQIARTVFSKIVLASAAMRTVFSVVKGALLSSHDPTIRFVATVISFALAACHLLISTVALVIGTNNLPALISKNGEAVEFKSNVEKIKEAINYFFDAAEKKLDELNEKGLVGWLGVVREWLMTSSAVIGFLSVLPLLVKTVGTILSAPAALIIGGSINLVAGIVEVAQGYKEYRLLNRELKELKELRESELKNGKLPDSDELLELQAAIGAKEDALLTSKVRIGKGVIGIVTSIGSIVLGVLAIAASINVPFLPALIAAISVFTVVVYILVSDTLTEMRKQAASGPDSNRAPSTYSPRYHYHWQR
jgi:hypothetical protein